MAFIEKFKDKRFLCRVGITFGVLGIGSILIWVLNNLVTSTSPATIENYFEIIIPIIGIIAISGVPILAVYFAWDDGDTASMLGATIMCAAVAIGELVVIVCFLETPFHVWINYIGIAMIIAVLAPATMWVYELIARPACRRIYYRERRERVQ